MTNVREQCRVQSSDYYYYYLNIFHYKIWVSESISKKAQDVNDLRRQLIGVRVGVEQNVIDDDIDQWPKCLHACTRATGGHFQYSSSHKLAKTLLTVIN